MEFSSLQAVPAPPEAGGARSAAAGPRLQYSALALVGDGSADAWVVVSHALLHALLGAPPGELMPRLDRAHPDKAARRAARERVGGVEEALLMFDGLLECSVVAQAASATSAAGSDAAAFGSLQLVVDRLVSPLPARFAYHLMRKTRSVV
jgi:hypothetical protein